MIRDGSTASCCTSRFAITRADVDAVLALRRATFGLELVCSDESYLACWLRNPYSMKIVFDGSGQALGYWSLTPIRREAFLAFRMGQRTHAQMLAEECLSWPSVDPDAAYLYIVGIAVAPAEVGDHRCRGYKLDRLSATVLLDAFNFGIELAGLLRVAGLCGYPSRMEGLRILQRKMGIEPSPVLMDGDARQPLFVHEGPDQTGLLAVLTSSVTLHHALVPVWDHRDRESFFSLIRQENRHIGPQQPRIPS
jgi:hypothetical protein